MTEQEKFEAWLKPSGLPINKRPNGAYQDGHVDDMWDGWQAAIASREPKPQAWTEVDEAHLKRGQENAKQAWAGVDVEKFLQREPQPMTEVQAMQIVSEKPAVNLVNQLHYAIRATERFHGIGSDQAQPA